MSSFVLLALILTLKSSQRPIMTLSSSFLKSFSCTSKLESTVLSFHNFKKAKEKGRSRPDGLCINRLKMSNFYLDLKWSNKWRLKRHCAASKELRRPLAEEPSLWREPFFLCYHWFWVKTGGTSVAEAKASGVHVQGHHSAKAALPNAKLKNISYNEWRSSDIKLSKKAEKAESWYNIIW